MNKMWSNKKYFDEIINILLFLVAINFMHYGQFLLPIICLLLFIDNNYKIKVNNIIVFIILCLFAVSFCAFSYKLGFYCVMGFCLPMAYYIGCNLKNPNEENIKKLIYIIAFGMSLHMILNFCLELSWWYDNIEYVFSKISHYDIWLYIKEINNPNGYDYMKVKIRATCTAMFYLPILGCSYYLMFYEKNKKDKLIGLMVFIVSSIYSIALGRRTTLVMMVIAILSFLVIDQLIIRNNKKIFMTTVIIGLFIVFTIIICYLNNLFGIKEIINHTRLMTKIINNGINADRISIFVDALKYYPKFLWGGQKISDIIGLQVHDLFGDIYDYAGIIPTLFITAYFIMVVINIMRVLKNYEKKMLLIIIPLFIITFVQMFLEPVMTGNSIFLICSIIFVTSIEKVS